MLLVTPQPRRIEKRSRALNKPSRKISYCVTSSFVRANSANKPRNKPTIISFPVPRTIMAVFGFLLTDAACSIDFWLLANPHCQLSYSHFPAGLIIGLVVVHEQRSGSINVICPSMFFGSLQQLIRPSFLNFKKPCSSYLNLLLRCYFSTGDNVFFRAPIFPSSGPFLFELTGNPQSLWYINWQVSTLFLHLQSFQWEYGEFLYHHYNFY